MVHTITQENRDVLYRLLAPIYVRLARLVPAAISPNQLTFAGLGCVLLASALLVTWSSPLAFVAAAALVLAYETLDCIDGKHARATGQTSRYGAFLDDAVDMITINMLFPALLIRLDLLSPVFIFAVAFRAIYQGVMYAGAVELAVRINPEIGTSFENYLIAGVLLLTFFVPGAIDVATHLEVGSWLRGFLVAQRLDGVDFVRALLLVMLVLMPISAVQGFIEVKRFIDGEKP